MFKLKKAVFDIYELNYDLGPGDIISTRTIQIPKDVSFKSVGGALKYVCGKIGTAYHKDDWNFEYDLDCKGNDGWVLHIMVEDETMKYATSKMIDDWKQNDEPKLVDVLANVFIERV